MDEYKMAVQAGKPMTAPDERPAVIGGFFAI